ncbi:MAG: FkbM family methyltransferase [Candidatus Pacebacteria bacterium]|nr:FkbM family methyltransferase [Candidatus Paceibacterota bacterium]
MSNQIAQSKARFIDLMLFFTFFQKTMGKRWVSKWLKNYKLAEQELSILPRILKKDSIIFDIGANRGELSFFFATKCNAKKVFAFEPQNRMFGILKGVAEKIKNIIPINIAFSDSTEKKVLNIPVKATGRYTPSASFDQLDEDKLKKEKVEIDILDNFIIKNNITKIDFIKCDTEGHELAILKGSEKTLMILRPILYIEIKDINKEPLFDLLKEKEYRPYQWNNKISSLVTVINEQNTQSENYYFFPIEKESYIIEIIKNK